MTNILGIKYGGHDTAAALVVDGELVSACAQERYTHDKHSRRFPKEAAIDCLRIGGINIDEVDELAFVNDYRTYIREIYLRPSLQSDDRMDFLFKDIDRITRVYKIEDLIRENLNYKGKINFYRHHLCHIASAYYPSGFNNALCLSLDGVGEFETGMIAAGKSGELEILNKNNVYPNSFGLLYSAITDYLGWKHHCDEGIIMGLAPYGNPFAKISGKKRDYISVFEEILIEKGEFEYEINLDLIDYYSQRDKWVTENFLQIFGPKRKSNGPILDHHKNIAAALQTRLECVVLKQLKSARKRFDLNKLCLAGGVALNCSMNGKIAQSNLFDEIFVQPASGDDGCTIGACLLAYKSIKGSLLPKKMHNFYKGSCFSEKEVNDAIKKSNLKFISPKNIYKTIAQYLADGKIIGWFQDSAEFGPRALGNRSILCRPYPASMKDYLNSRVKFREDFRPFAPSVLENYQSQYFDLNQDSPHMLIACQVKSDKRNVIPAVVHVDGTCRVHTVKKELNEKLYNLLEQFNVLTGVPIILNTSFNIKGQPIVNTPEEAINTFKTTKIDVLVLGNSFVIKDKNNQDI